MSLLRRFGRATVTTRKLMHGEAPFSERGEGPLSATLWSIAEKGK